MTQEKMYETVLTTIGDIKVGDLYKDTLDVFHLVQSINHDSEYVILKLEGFSERMYRGPYEAAAVKREIPYTEVPASEVQVGDVVWFEYKNVWEKVTDTDSCMESGWDLCTSAFSPWHYVSKSDMVKVRKEPEVEAVIEENPVTEDKLYKTLNIFADEIKPGDLYEGRDNKFRLVNSVSQQRLRVALDLEEFPVILFKWSYEKVTVKREVKENAVSEQNAIPEVMKCHELSIGDVVSVALDNKREDIKCVVISLARFLVDKGSDHKIEIEMEILGDDQPFYITRYLNDNILWLGYSVYDED